METNGAFWSLVRHDMKLRKHGGLRLSKQWRTAYLMVTAVIVVAATTYSSLQGNLDFRNVWFIGFGIPLVVLGLSTGLTIREWKNGTVGWWLAMPVSRVRLVTSKFSAALVRSMLIFLALYCIVAVLSVYATLIQGTFSVPSLEVFLFAGLKWFALLTCFCPFFGAFGVLLAILRESHARPVLPLIWAAVGGAWWLLSARSHGVLQHPEAAAGPGFVWHSSLWIVLLISWVAAYLMLRLASYLLERQLSL